MIIAFIGSIALKESPLKRYDFDDEEFTQTEELINQDSTKFDKNRNLDSTVQKNLDEND